MRIIEFMGMNSTKYGGIEKFNVELARQGQSRGMEFVFVYYSLPAAKAYRDELERLHASVRVISNVSSARYIKDCLSLIVREKPDIVHFHFGNEQLYLAPIIRFRFPKIRQVCTQHSEFLTKKIIRIFQKRLEYSCVEKVLAVSKGVAKELERKLGDNPKITVSYLGVKPPSALAESELKKELGAGQHDVVLTAIGFDVWIKGYDVLAKSVQRLAANAGLPGFKVLIIGLSEAENKKFLQITEELNVTGYFKSLGIRNDVERFLAVSDIYLQPSRTEAISLTIMEALQYGLPIVASNVGGIPEVVFPEVNGFLTEPCDDRELAEKLALLISDKALRLRLGMQSKKLAPNFRNENGVGALMDIYAQLA